MKIDFLPREGQGSSIFRSVWVVLLASLFVMSVVYAATTVGTSITTGGNLTVTGNASVTGNINTAGTLVVTGKATTTSLWIGGSGSGTATSTAAASGDLFVDNSLEVKNKLYAGGGLFSLSTGTATTTKGLFVGATGSTGTTTVGVGTVATGGVNGCLELTMAGLYYACYISPTTPPTFVCSVNRCNP